ncbi:MAG TPA: serine/threonine protein kinase, partial [Gemmataceae bacterium]|nr:serine/threonine protein kinase [Gemmataceae bacterium]
MGLFDFLFGKNGGSGKRRKNLKRVNVAKRFEGLVRSGQGSMSRVFRTYDREIGRTVCLKLLDKLKTQKF